MAALEYRVCTGCNKRRQTKFFVSDRGRVCADCRKRTARAGARKSHLEKTYELTQEEYDKLLEAQDGACAICQGVRPYKLQVDHDHALAELWGIRASVRGLLCKRCNKLLRDVHDSTGTLSAMVNYLNDPPARSVLRLAA